MHYSVPNKVDVNALVGFNDKETQTHSVSGAYTQVEDNDLFQADLFATFHMMDNQFLLTVGSQGVKETATVTKHNLSSPSDSDSWASVATQDSGESLTWGTFIQAEYTPAEVPTDIFNCWLGYFTDFLDASVNLRYSDSVYDDRRDTYASSVFNDYTDSFVVDAQLTVRPGKKVSLTLSVDNLLDEEYYE